MPKKIIRIIARLNIGGPAIHVTNLNYYLDKEYHYESTLIHGSLAAGEGSMEYLATEKNLKTIVIPELGREISFLKDIRTIWKLYKIIRKEKPDIVHTHTAKAGTVGRLAASLAGVKQIYHTFHGHVFHSYFGKLKTRLFIYIERFLAKFTTKIITISEKQREEILFYKITKPQKVIVIPLGFELEKFKDLENRNILRKRYNIPENYKLIGIIGRLAPVKNHKYFIEVAEEILKHYQKVKFLIIGDGELKEELANLVKQKGLENNIIFTGFIKKTKDIYSELDIVALTSLNEGTPVTIIEAMACGLPVIATNVGGVQDIIEINGILENLNDKEKFAKDIVQMINHYQKYKDKAIQTRSKILNKYSVKNLVNNLHRLYS